MYLPSSIYIGRNIFVYKVENCEENGSCQTQQCTTWLYHVAIRMWIKLGPYYYRAAKDAKAWFTCPIYTDILTPRRRGIISTSQNIAKFPYEESYNGDIPPPPILHFILIWLWFDRGKSPFFILRIVLFSLMTLILLQ